GYAEPRQYVISNIVEFEVVEATRQWVEQTVEACAKTLRAPPDPNGGNYGIRERAARQLRYLQQPAGWKAALDLIETNAQQLLAGLAEAPDAKTVCGLMRSGLSNPQQYVTAMYLSTLGTVCAKSGSSQPAQQTELAEWVRKQNEAAAHVEDEAADALA